MYSKELSLTTESLFRKSHGQMSCTDITWIGLNYNYTSNESLWMDNSVLSFDGLWATAQPSNNGKCISHFAWGGFWLTQQCNSTGGSDTFFCQLRTSNIRQYKS